MDWKKHLFMLAWLPVVAGFGAAFTVTLRRLGVGEVVLAFAPMVGVFIAWIAGQMIWARIKRR